MIFHGRWHQQNRCRLNARSEVVGLAADGHPANASILSISDLKASYAHVFQRGPDGRPARAAILSVSALQATYTDICD